MATTEKGNGKTSTEEDDRGETETAGKVRKCRKDTEKEPVEETMKLPDGRGMGSTSDHESVGELGNVASFEDLLQLVGTSGRWNVLIFIVCSSCTFISAMQSLSYQFLGATPDHWCHVAPLVEANWTEEQIISFAIPKELNKTGKHDGCHMYEYDYGLVTDMGYEAAVASGLTPQPDKTSVVPCDTRNFNLTQYDSTVTTEWDLVCERRVLYSSTQAAVQVGQLLDFMSGYLLGRFGRRPVVLCSSFLLAVSGFVTCVLPNVESYIFLKAVTQAVDFSVFLGCFVIVMETCSAQERSKLGTLFVVPWALGYMVLPGVAYFVRRWRWLQAALTLPVLSIVLYYWLLPESPRWLILQGRYEEALEVLRWGARVNRRKLPPDHDLRVAMEKIRPTGTSNHKEEQETLIRRVTSALKQLVALLIRRDLRQRTLVVFFCWFTSSMVYYGVALNSTNLSADPYLYIFLGGLLEMPSYLLIWPATVFLGRVKILSLLYLFCALSILPVTILTYFFPEASITATTVFSLSGKMAITSAYQLIWILTAELFPTQYRSLVVGLSSFLSRLGSIASPYINDILGEVLVWAPSAIFGLASLVAAVLSLLLPETKGRNLSEDNKLQDDPQQTVTTAVARESDAQLTGTTEMSYLSETKSDSKESRDHHCNAAYESQTEEEGEQVNIRL